MVSVVKLAEVPECLQFNEFILHGYRRPLTYMGCWRSLLRLHNETANIVTHLGAFCVFVYLLLHRLWPEAPWLYYTSISSLVVCMLNSVLYHTFMNMTAHYDTWLLLDVLGIFGCFFVCEVAIVWLGFACFPHLRLPSLLVYYPVAFFALYKVGRAETMADRAKYMSVLGLMRGAILMLRMFLSAGTPFALRMYVAMELVGLLGAVLNVSKVPERWYSGVFDYACNSHMLMHLCAFGALGCCYVAMTDDYRATYLGALAGTACVHVR